MRRFALELVLGVLLSASRAMAADAPENLLACDSTAVTLEAAGAVDMVQAFQRDVRDLVRNRLVGIAEERAANLLRLDEVRFRDPDNGRGGHVRLSKLIGSRVEMYYVGAVGHASEQRLRLDVRVSDRLILQSESDPQGRTASDLVWRLSRR